MSMKKLITKSVGALAALAVVVATMPASVFAATYTIIAPSSVTITESALISSTSGVANNSRDVAAYALANSDNSIEMTLKGDGVDPGVARARISATQVSGGPGTVQLWIHESSSDKWYDTTITGWGPANGFPITSDYDEDVTVVAVADQAGTYTLNYEVVDLDATIIASGQSTLIVEEQTSAQVATEQELNDAIADSAITDVALVSSFTINATVDVNRAIAIDGSGYTISASNSVTGTGLLITGDNVTVSNLTIDANGRPIQGIQAYVAENVTLRNVTAKNAGKSGIMVNGSTVTVEDVTTLGNNWHGINVDQGSGVTSPAVLTVAGVSSHLETGPAIYVDDTASGSVTGAMNQYTEFSAAPAVAYFLSTVDSEDELKAALANPAISTIALGGDITTTSAVTVSRSLTIEGNGHTVSGNFVKTSSSNNSVFLVTASNVTMSNLVVDGLVASNNLHGINIYVATGIVLDDIETKNVNTGVNVNGSTVSVSNVTTSNSAWHGINVDQGSGVTSPAVLTVTGTSAHTEAEGIHHIWIDDITLTNVSVVDVTGQYNTTEIAWDDAGTPRTGRSYILRVIEPGSGSGGGGGGGGSRRSPSQNNANETQPAGEIAGGEGEVLGASAYNFAVDMTIGSTGQDVIELQTILIAEGYLKIAAPTGYFGPLTAAAVKLYQAAKGIPATGYVGPLTRAALNEGSEPVSSDVAKLTAMIAQLQAMLAILKSL